MKRLLFLYLLLGLGLLGLGSFRSLESRPAADPLTAAFERFAADDLAAALDILAGHVRAGAGRLPGLEGEEADRLADDLELSLVVMHTMAADLGNPLYLEALLKDVQVDRSHGMLAASLAWTRNRGLQDLAPLVKWSFVGPFDNERGRGMTQATPAELDPKAESYKGKVQQISWRALPKAAPEAGIVNLGLLVDPSQHACVVARTWVRSDVGRDVLLLMGATEELRVWVQGKARFEALEGYELGVDAHVLPLHLDAGWTELVVKVGSGEFAGPSFVARLVDPVRGRVLALEQRAQAPEGIGPRQLEDPGASIDMAETPARPGAWRRHARGGTPEDRFRLAVLQVYSQNAPRAERPGRVAAQAAATARPGVLRYGIARLSTLRERRALATEEDTNPWREAVDGLLATHGDLARLLRARAKHAAFSQGLWDTALDFNRRALEASPTSVQARLQRIRLLSSTGQEQRAEAYTLSLARDPLAHIWASIAVLLARSLPIQDTAREALLQSAAGAGYTSAHRLLAEQRRLDQDDRSSAGLRADLAMALSEHPWSSSLRYGAARTAQACGHGDLALEWLDDALELLPHGAHLHRYRSGVLWRLGRHEDSVVALERALELDFTDEDGRRLLEFLKQADTGAFYDAWEESLESILARRAADQPVEDAGAGREILLDRRVVEVNPDGSSRRYRRQVQRVLSEAGARALDQRSWRAYPGQEEVRVLAARVLHADGSIDEAPTGRSGNRGYVAVDLPPLVAGDIVDLAWRRDEQASEVFGNYFGLNVSLVTNTNLHMREGELVLISPPSLPLTLHTRELETAEQGTETLADGRRVDRWRIVDRTPRRTEPLMPPVLESDPRVQASTYSSWDEFGRWWWSLIDDEIRVSPEMRTRVGELCADASTPIERLHAIYDFVVTDIRYNAWEFGVHGYEPYSTPVIFSRGFGDCKDKAILLRALLGVVNIEAWPVLIRSEGRRHEEDISLPLVAHFNHCIAYVPEQEGIPSMYLDGTARLHPLEVLPASDAGAKVVIISDSEATVARIPFPSHEVNLERRVIHVDLTDAAGTKVSVSLEPAGRFDPRDRYRFTGSEEERDEEAERVLSGLFGPLRGVPETQWPDFEDLSSAPVTVLESGVESATRKTSQGFELKSSFDPLYLLRGLAAETTRTTDLLLDVPWSQETVLEYELGQGADPRSLPPEVRLENEDAGYSRTVTRTETGVRIVERFELKTHRIPAERYAAFRELSRAVDQAQAVNVEVEVKP
ncbi:MAG: tetratricopeptide (TPR) repeat protein/transglutaminase-like putative cysteine protease [Planctomycetota bacterium]|jgi:tetratricopeptide (TPR) repeat protein/transglutaminase-like putative cysteine protease